MAGTTADDLVDKLKQILVRVSVSEDQIMTPVTDGARNERAVGCRADFCQQSYHIWCFNHRLNLVVGDGMAGRCRAIRRTAGEEEAEGGIVNGGGENEIGMWEFLLGQGIVNANDLIEVLSSNFFVGNEDAESGEEEEEEGEVRSWEGAQDSEFDERSVFLIYIMIIC